MRPGTPRPPVPAAAPGRRAFWPVLALALVAPSIPELLTGSTPVTTLFLDPPAFVLDFLGLMALYGGGAILIHEFVARRHLGWASVLLLGAAYGIGEEGFAVHTFFEPSGGPVDAFATYGHFAGVNWLWALGLTVFHAIYSIALPLLLVGLWYPEWRDRPWLGPRGVVGAAAAYLGIVTLFALVVGHGPGPGAFVLFLVLALGLVGLAVRVPRDLLAPVPGRPRLGPWTLGLAASLPFDAWTFILIQSSRPVLPAGASALLLVIAGATGATLVRFGAGSTRPEWTRWYLLAGALAPIFAWDLLVEFEIPGILLVTALYLYLLYRLRGTLRARESRPVPVPLGVRGPAA